MARALSIAMLVAIVAAGVPAQIVYAEDPNPTTGLADSIPWGQSGGYTSLHVYEWSWLLEAGICAGATLTDFAIVAAGTTGTYHCANARLQIGRLATYPPIPGNWTSHLVAPVTLWDTAVNGPFTFPWVGNTWNSLPGVAGSGFVWDGASHIGVLYTHTGATGTFTTRTTSGLRHGVATYNATTTTPTSTGRLAMKARLTFTGGAAKYQVNQAAASLDVNGIATARCRPATVKTCPGVVTTVHFASSLPGNGWELAGSVGELLHPLNSGTTVLPASGQIVNLNLASPGLFLLNGLSFPPFPGNFSFPFSAPGQFRIAAQMAVIDPSNPSLLALSGGVNIEYDPYASTFLPLTDNTVATYTLGQPPLCGPPSVRFYGTTYTQFSVTENGRVMFGPSSNAGTPTLPLATGNPGFVGHWSDFDLTFAGQVGVHGLPTQVMVNWFNVPYASHANSANSFHVVFDTVTDSISLEFLGGISVHPAAANAVLGISRGLGATDAGPAAFTPPGAGITTNATDMIYRYGAAGTLAPGLDWIRFIPNAFGNYDWISSF